MTADKPLDMTDPDRARLRRLAKERARDAPEPEDCPTIDLDGYVVEFASLLALPNDSPCDDGLFCTLTDECNGTGSCLGTQSPCPGQNVGPACNDSCNEGSDNCTGNDSNVTSCDDGLWCSGTDTCDGAGTRAHTGDP